MQSVAQHHVDTKRSLATVQDVVESVAGSSRLEGVTIPDEHQQLAAAFLAGEIDADEYRAKARALTLVDLGLDG
jgi:Antitoxin VbhA